MEPVSYATREDIWRLQESFNELSAIQVQHSDRIMRLEKRQEGETRVKSLWPTTPTSGPAGILSQPDLGYNPAAEAFKAFEVDTQTGGIGSLSLDNDDERRRGLAARANSVRFDESANNHYGSNSRQSIDIPFRTGSGLGSHPMSERSLSHRSDGRGSASGLSNRANSFGIDQSRLLSSINNSPRISGNPPPGFFVLGPVPAIIRCWLTETFSNGSLLYAAICTGSAVSCIGSSLVQELGLSDQTFEESGLGKIKLPVYLTEARIRQPSSRPASPSPQVPTLTAKFLINESPMQDKSIQVVLGSDVLRAHNADILFSQDRLMIFDEARNQLTVPLVRPENEVVYENLATSASMRSDGQSASVSKATSSDATTARTALGAIGHPGRINTSQAPMSDTTLSPNVIASAASSEMSGLQKQDHSMENTPRSSTDLGQTRPVEEARSATESEKSFHITPTTRSNSGVWNSASWRSTSTTNDVAGANKTASGYSRPNAPRPMKVLRPGKSMSNASRINSSTALPPNGVENERPKPVADDVRRTSLTGTADAKTAQSAPTKANPVGSASAFGWLNSNQPKRSVMNGD